ncbi:cation:proton antiporter regulatory subunit [Paenibacillus taiwanensis]|uniref:cation:proton antiporter regulatory subunit n=1 Tax=Paenibacillus taiwanensis TaxID=401638 RepID=UPI000419F324|nr:cation:proton antiporter regulatory subunit [Paenibacillus taiwanensis]
MNHRGQSSLHFKETDLPGIGRKYNLRTRSGENLVIVVHHDQRYDLFQMDNEDGDNMLSMLTLDEEEAKALALIMGGISYMPEQEKEREVMLGGLLIEWLRLAPQSLCLGKTIGELNVRHVTGATILAVVEHNKTTLINPGAQYKFVEGLTLVVAGERAQVNQLKQLLESGKL